MEQVREQTHEMTNREDHFANLRWRVVFHGHAHPW